MYAQQGMIDIKSFVKSNTPEKSYALILNTGHEIETILIEKKLYLAAKNMNGEKSISEILRSVGADQDEADEFINFLIESKLISSAKN